MRKLSVLSAESVEYGRAVKLQLELVERAAADPETEYLLLLEHPSVITLGRTADAAHVLLDKAALARCGVAIFESSRGGDVTWHGPGQLVGYPIVSLARRKVGVREYLRKLEDVVIGVLADFAIDAGRDPEHTGVWVNGRKVCAIGVAVRHWVTYHGFALNVDPDMRAFSMITPCGIADKGVASMAQLLRERDSGATVPTMHEVREAVARHFARVFPMDAVQAEDPAVFLDGRKRFPPWMRKRVRPGATADGVRELLTELKLATVCQSAVCPNQCECFGERTATFMILGRTCTRNCRFCAVAEGQPASPEPDEPERVARAAARLGLRHVVITSVTRDDLADGGADVFARTIAAVRTALPQASIEVLVPDFQGDDAAIARVSAARPDVLNHNVETVKRLYGRVRPGAKYERSLELLRRARELNPETVTKSGLMVGLGETRLELRRTFRDLRQAGVELLTVGQYLAPTREHHPIIRFVTPEEFREMEEEALELGFVGAACGPFVRSSYRAGELFQRARMVRS